MGKLLVEKKKFDALKKNTKLSDEQKYKLQKKIDLKQQQAKQILADLKKLKERRQAQCVYSYIQFQSMNGKQKFLKAMDVGKCKRYCPCGDKRLKNKYLGKRWPAVSEAPDPTLIIWKNLGKGKIERCCRNLTIFLAAIVLLAVGFLAIVKLYEVNEDFKS